MPGPRCSGKRLSCLLSVFTNPPNSRATHHARAPSGMRRQSRRDEKLESSGHLICHKCHSSIIADYNPSSVPPKVTLVLYLSALLHFLLARERAHASYCRNEATRGYIIESRLSYHVEASESHALKNKMKVEKQKKKRRKKRGGGHSSCPRTTPRHQAKGRGKESTRMRVESHLQTPQPILYAPFRFSCSRQCPRVKLWGSGNQPTLRVVSLVLAPQLSPKHAS